VAIAGFSWFHICFSRKNYILAESTQFAGFAKATSRETLVLSAEIRTKLHHYFSIFNQNFTEKSLREKCCVELLNLKIFSRKFLR
jgi:hypothetical protein